jgi:hypothetical protein
MNRVAALGGVCLLVLGLTGCTSLLTARAIESFSAELSAGNLAGLQETTSADFQSRALRADGALESLKVLPLPSGAGEVTAIEETGPDERLVTMQIGEPPQTVKYVLKRETADETSLTSLWAAGEWKVHDVILTRDRGEGKAPQTKSITDQMDVLLTAQEFMSSWRNGSREETLALLHPELRSRMEALSAVHLAQITEHMLDGLKDESFRPEARIQTNHAVVLLPRRGGKLQLSLEHSPEQAHRWVIRDIVKQSSRNDEPEVSVAHLASCVGRATEFLNAYQQQDLAALKTAASDTFYSQSLATADFSTAPLPVPQILASRYTIEEQAQRTDLLFELGDDTYLVSMSREEQEAAVLPEHRTGEPPYRVDEVTIYERGGEQIKPLSVVFTAQAVVEVFADALATRDLSMVSQLSSRDLEQRVWSRLDTPDLFRSLPLDVIPAAEPQVVTTVFQGPVTEITVTQGTRALTYVLHSTTGRPLVDDVRYPANNRPGSLKTSLEAVVPVYNFASAWSRQDRDGLEENSSDGVRRMVWMRSGVLPNVKAPLDQFLGRALPKMDLVGSDPVLTFGSAERGMQVRLVTEGQRLVVEDIHLTDPSLAGGRLEFVNAMRQWITIQEGRPVKRTVAAPANPMAAAPDRQLAVLPVAAEAASTPTAPPTSTDPAAAPMAADTLPLIQRPIAIPGT